MIRDSEICYRYKSADISTAGISARDYEQVDKPRTRYKHLVICLICRNNISVLSKTISSLKQQNFCRCFLKKLSKNPCCFFMLLATKVAACRELPIEAVNIEEK